MSYLPGVLCDGLRSLGKHFVYFLELRLVERCATLMASLPWIQLLDDHCSSHRNGGVMVVSDNFDGAVVLAHYWKRLRLCAGYHQD